MPVVDTVIWLLIFMGSGSTIKAAMALGRRALGVELESERFNQTVKEINELVGNNLVATSGGLFISITQHPHLRGGVMKSMDKLTTVSPMAPQQVVPGTGFYSCSIKSRPHSGRQ